MNAQRNYNTYLSGMERGNAEKLFFLNKIDLNDFDTVIDFGCGGGDVIHAVAECDPRRRLALIAIDQDEYMLKIAKQKTPDLICLNELSRTLINEKTLIIFNSVLHEVENYWVTLKDILNNTGATVVVRDMRFGRKDNPLIDKNDLANLVFAANNIHLSDFIRKYGMRQQKDLYHFLLKYSYVDNWELEVTENYFSFDWDDLISMGNVLYENNYVLEFKKQQVKNHFNIDLTIPTHCQLILKLNKGD